MALEQSSPHLGNIGSEERMSKPNPDLIYEQLVERKEDDL